MDEKDKLEPDPENDGIDTDDTPAEDNGVSDSMPDTDAIIEEYLRDHSGSASAEAAAASADGGDDESAPDEDTDNGDDDSNDDGSPDDNSDNAEEEDDEYDEDDEYEDDFDYSEMYAELERSRRKKREKGTGGKLIFGLVFTVLIVSISVAIAVYVMQAAKAITGIDRSDMKKVIEIPENSTAADIAAILYDEGIIADEKLFVLFSKVKKADSSYIAGSHVLSPNMTYDSIIDTLQQTIETEERAYADITFQEGITLIDAAKALEQQGICEADRFIYIFNSSMFGFDFEVKVKADPKKFYRMEGFLFPDTYTFYLDEEPEVVTKKIRKNFDSKITPDYYGRMDDLGLTLEQTITLASMVQAEGRTIDDMKKIASVFMNRLNNSETFPKLESDPTSKYVTDVIKPNIDLPNEEMYRNYDTYKGEGLPPGPICNPGLDAINAVLYPAETNFFFFCANIDTGEVYFAETLEEHERNLLIAAGEEPEEPAEEAVTEETKPTETTFTEWKPAE